MVWLAPHWLLQSTIWKIKWDWCPYTKMHWWLSRMLLMFKTPAHPLKSFRFIILTWEETNILNRRKWGRMRREIPPMVVEIIIMLVVSLVFDDNTFIQIVAFMLYLGFHFHHWWNSYPLSASFIIDSFLKDIFYLLFSFGACRICIWWRVLKSWCQTIKQILDFVMCSCWLMGNEIREFRVPRGLQSLIIGSLSIDVRNTSMSLDWYILQVFYVNSFIHTC